MPAARRAERARAQGGEARGVQSREWIRQDGAPLARLPPPRHADAVGGALFSILVTSTLCSNWAQ